jgi:hypothetical protein
MLKGIAGANLVRRQRVGLVAVQAFGISRQLSRDPNYADLLPHVEEIRRLKNLGRRKKSAPQVPQSPQSPQSPEPPQHLES